MSSDASATSSTSTTVDNRIIPISSNDDKTFEVTRSELRCIGTLDNLFKNMGYEDDTEKAVEVLPCPAVDGATLELVVEFVKHHVNQWEMSEEDKKKDKRTIPLPQWDRDFVPKNEDALYNLYVASNYLHVQKLMDVCAQYIASLIQGKSTVEIGKIYGIECDLTPAEQEQIRKENAWCED